MNPQEVHDLLLKKIDELIKKRNLPETSPEEKAKIDKELLMLRDKLIEYLD